MHSCMSNSSPDGDGSASKTKRIFKCCIPECKSDSRSFHLHIFPENDVKKKLWQDAIMEHYQLSSLHDLYMKLNITKTSRLCELHFTSDNFYEQWKEKKHIFMKENAVPSLFSVTDVKLNALAGISGLPGKTYLLDEMCPEVASNIVVNETADTSLIPLVSKERRKHVDHSYSKPPKKDMSTSKLAVLLTELDVTSEVSASMIDTTLDQTAESVQDLDESWNPSDNDDTQYSLDESIDSVGGKEGSLQYYRAPADVLSDSQYKFALVGLENILELFPQYCSTCTNAIHFSIDASKGSGMIIHAKCSSSKSKQCYFRKWSSQKKINKTWSADLRVSGGIVCTGSSPSKTLRLLRFLQMPIFSIRNFYRHQKKYVVPGVVRVWRKHQSAILEDLKATGKPLDLSGDGSCDSIGHSATYCRYVLFENNIRKVVDVQLVKKSEVGGHSPNMERLGLEKGLRSLLSHQFEIRSLVTDRHRSIKAWLRREHGTIQHFFDIWHCAKGLSKKLRASSAISSCQDIQLWIPAAVNHLYWVAQNGKTADERVAMWASIANHVVNVHQHESVDYPSCAHGELDDNIAYLIAGSKAAVLFEKTVTDRNVIDDVKRLSPVHQTYYVESLNSILGQMAPKNTYYGFLGHAARVMVGAIHFNCNIDKPQATTRAGEQKWRVRYLKHRKNLPSVQPIRESADYGYLDQLREAIEDAVLTDHGGHEGRMLQLLEPPSTSRPPFVKSELVEAYRSRFAGKDGQVPASSYQFTEVDVQKRKRKSAQAPKAQRAATTRSFKRGRGRISACKKAQPSFSDSDYDEFDNPIGASTPAVINGRTRPRLYRGRVKTLAGRMEGD